MQTSIILPEERGNGQESKRIVLPSTQLAKWNNGLRRVVDTIIAIASLVVFSPLFAICYVAIKMEDGGHVFFAQERIGLGGKPFNIYKFRSMKIDAEKDGPDLFQHEKSDKLTKVGRFLRNHHLDELPHQIMEHDPRYVYLYQVRPGVTSYATLYNGYTDTMEKMLRRLELDLYYLEHRSWWFDFKILVKTFLNIVFGKVF